MYYDLNIRIDAKNRNDALEELHRLGFDVVAFTTAIKGTSQLLPENCPQRTSAKTTWSPTDDTSATLPSSHVSKRKKNITVLERVTLVIEDSSQLVLLTSPLLSKFDIVAIQPSTEKLLQQCLQFDFDVISVCLSKKQQFHIKKPHVNVAAEKGVMFEVSYADALRDRATRRFVVSNACALSRVTSKKHIILSSGAQRIMELRGPHDTINLGMIFDLPYDSGRNSVTNLPQQVVAHGDVRANTYKGIVRVVGEVQPLDQDKLKLSSQDKPNNARVNDSCAMSDI